MRFQLPNGRMVWKNIEKSRIDWDKPCRSKPQFLTKKFFQKFWSKDVVYEEMRIPNSRLSVDLINFTKKIAVEEGGIFHWEYHEWAHKGSRSNYLKSLGNDNKKREFLELNGFTVIELKDTEVPLLTQKWFLEKFEIKL